MNILFLDQYSDLGGAQACLLDLMPAIQAQGWSAQAVLPGHGRWWAGCVRCVCRYPRFPAALTARAIRGWLIS